MKTSSAHRPILTPAGVRFALFTGSWETGNPTHITFPVDATYNTVNLELRDMSRQGYTYVQVSRHSRVGMGSGGERKMATKLILPELSEFRRRASLRRILADEGFRQEAAALPGFI